LPLSPGGGGRTWWAHFKFTLINIALTIPKNQFEDVREAGAFTVRTGDVGKPYGVYRE
jgi:hypothetical protein